MARKPEFHLCTAFYKWWQWFAKLNKLDQRDLYHIANQGTHGNPRTGAMLKLLGVTAGVSDYMLSVPSGTYHGLYLEAKSQTGKASPEQLSDHELRRKRGYRVEIFRSLDQAQKIIMDYLSGNKT